MPDNDEVKSNLSKKIAYDVAEELKADIGDVKKSETLRIKRHGG